MTDHEFVPAADPQEGAEPRQERISLKDLSKRLNLSPTTVSRALNGFPEVSAATRERVAEAARLYGYRPDRNARRLAQGRVGAVGLVFPAEASTLIDPIQIEFLAGVGEAAAAAQMEITLIPAQRADEIGAYRRAASERSVDGFIVGAPQLRDPRVKELAALEIPFALYGRTEGAGAHAWCDIDHREAFARATRLLTELGHRRFALVNGRAEESAAMERRAGAVSALEAKGLRLEPPFAFHIPMTEEEGYRAARLCFQRAPSERPTAFLVSSVFLALGLMRAAREAGLSAPRDFSVIVHDDRTPYLRGEFFDPPLTAASASIRDAGRRATELLCARLEGTPPENLQEMLPLDLVMRASTGPARS